MFTCNVCRKRFMSAFNLKRHGAKSHPTSLDETSSEGPPDRVDDGKQAVLSIVCKVIANMDEIEVEDDLENSDVYNEMWSRVKKRMLAIMNKAEALKHSQFVKEVEQSVDKYRKTGLSLFESREMAWDERRFLLKKFIQDNWEDVAELFESSTSESDVGEEDDNDDESMAESGSQEEQASTDESIENDPSSDDTLA